MQCQLHRPLSCLVWFVFFSVWLPWQSSAGLPGIGKLVAPVVACAGGPDLPLDHHALTTRTAGNFQCYLCRQFGGYQAMHYQCRKAPSAGYRLACMQGKGVRWAMAGRSQAKLQEVRKEVAAYNHDVENVELIVADLADQASVNSLAASSKVHTRLFSKFAPWRL